MPSRTTNDASRHLDAWIENPVHNVYDKIHQRHRDGDENDGRLDHRHILGLNRAHREKADAWNLEQRFREKRAADDKRERRTDRRDERHQRVTEGMPEDYRTLAQTLCPRPANVLLLERIQHARPRATR